MRQGSCLQEFSRDQPRPIISNQSSLSDQDFIDPKQYRRRKRRLLIFFLSIVLGFLLSVLIIYLVQHINDEDEEEQEPQPQPKHRKKKHKQTIDQIPIDHCRQIDSLKQAIFGKQKLLIADFQGLQEVGEFEQTAGNELIKNGFLYDIIDEEEEFIEDVANKYNIIWIISNSQIDDENDFQQYLATTDSLIAKKRNLFLLADNSPHTMHANLLLERHFDGMTLSGNYRGQHILKASQQIQFEQKKKRKNHHSKGVTSDAISQKIVVQAGEFNKNHALACDINEIYEGNTVCRPNKVHPDFKVFAYNYNNEPLILYAPANEWHGRIIIDCGFSKIYKAYWDFQDNDQYIANANYWLAGVPE